MTLSFSTTWPDCMGDLAGQPNYFPEKILSGLPGDPDVFAFQNTGYDFSVYAMQELPFKFHTIREDQQDRWKPGMIINFVIFNRTKNRFEFARAKCTAVQEISIKHSHVPYAPGVFVGDDMMHRLNDDHVLQLAINDGFPSVEAFFMWFDRDFKGKIIHWGNLRY